MWDWIIVIFCFVCVAVARTFLFKKSYKQKMKYYTHPYDLAQEVLAESRKKQTEIQYQNSVKIDRIAQLIGYNLGCTSRLIDGEQPDFDQICEKLRNISMYICLIKIIHEKNSQVLSEQLKVVASVIGPHLDIFSKVRKYIEAQNADEKKKNKRDKYLDKSIDNYIQHIVEDLSGYMFGF